MSNCFDNKCAFQFRLGAADLNYVFDHVMQGVCRRGIGGLVIDLLANPAGYHEPAHLKQLEVMRKRGA